MVTQLCRLAAFIGPVLLVLACEKSDTGGQAVPQSPAARECPAERDADCAAVKTRIEELGAARDQALAANDATAVARVSLELNHQTERLDLLLSGATSPEAEQALESKYQRLGDLLEQRLLGTSGKPGDKQSPGPSESELSPLVYHPLEIEAVQSVTAKFGELYITDTGTDATGRPAGLEASVPMPWAGYWYPLAGTELFEGDAAPLAKLDRITARLGTPTTAAAKEREFRAIAAEDSWEGRCSAWAIASVTSTEPNASIQVEGETFSIADRKAIAVKAHEAYPLEHYGIRYNGDQQTDGTIQDIRPEAFHRIFQSVLVEGHQPFIIDDDPGIEVWSKPVYRMRWSIRKDPDIAYAYLIDAFPFMVSHRLRETEEPTSVSDRTAPAYKYRLYVDPNPSTMRDGKFKVIAGEWLESSRDNHPDSIVLAAPGGALASNNSEINRALDVVRRILGAP